MGLHTKSLYRTGRRTTEFRIDRDAIKTDGPYLHNYVRGPEVVIYKGYTIMDKIQDLQIASLGQRFKAALIDILITVPLFPYINKLILEGYQRTNLTSILILNIIGFLAVVTFVTKLGGTPGKLLMKLRIVDRNGNYLTWWKSIVRRLFFADYITIVYFTKNIHAMQMMHNNKIEITMANIGEALIVFGKPFAVLEMLCLLLFIIDLGFAIKNAQNRSLHDKVARSHVITVE